MTATTEQWTARQNTTSSGPASRHAEFDVLAERAAAVGVAILIVTGFVASYTTLRDLATEVGQFPTWLAPVVPLSFDVGIIVLSLKVLLAARAGRRAGVLRALVLTLSVATVVANGASADHLTGRLLHAVPSAMFVICFETVVSSARRTALATADGQPAPRPFRPARWLLAPRATCTRWRAHVLTDHHPLRVPVDATSLDTTASVTPAWEPAISQGNHATRPTQKAFDDDRQDARNAAPSTQPANRSMLQTTPASKQHRLQAARAIVREQPDITSAALAEALTDAGHPVSLRTAHRVRDEVRADTSKAPK